MARKHLKLRIAAEEEQVPVVDFISHSSSIQNSVNEVPSTRVGPGNSRRKDPVCSLLVSSSSAPPVSVQYSGPSTSSWTHSTEIPLDLRVKGKGKQKQETQKSARFSVSPSQELGNNDKNARRIRKNRRAQLLRDEERYRQSWMLVQARQMEKRNLALNANLENLEAVKALILSHAANVVSNLSLE